MQLSQPLVGSFLSELPSFANIVLTLLHHSLQGNDMNTHTYLWVYACEHPAMLQGVVKSHTQVIGVA